jgi:hypothetical protein
MLLTYEMLLAKKVCEEQADKFRDLFPYGVVLTEALCVSHANDFDFNCAANNLLRARARKAYKEAYARVWEPYQEACVRAKESCEKAIAPARQAFQEAIAAAFFAAWQADHVS